jgi:hypothetical protein
VATGPGLPLEDHMPSRIARLAAIAVLCTSATLASAQVRTTGQLVGTVTDPTGAVIADVEVQVEDVGTSIRTTTRSNREGGFVFPALQPGQYRLIATASGFHPVVREGVVIETGRASNVVLQFEAAGVAETVSVQANASVIETTSTVISSTVNNAQIQRLPLPNRNVLDFSLLVPGTATSAGTRFSAFNGLPGGAINITLDGINNNSQRFRSGGTSFFVFAPVRLGAIEEVTVSTSGLGADAGAEGAVQVQFVTRRGTSAFHGQVFDQIRNEGLNANTPLNNARRLPKPRIRQHEFGANLGGPIIRNKLFFFGNYEQIYTPGTSTQTRVVLTPEAQQGVFRYLDTAGAHRTVNLLELARTSGFPATIDPTIAGQLSVINRTVRDGTLTSRDLVTQDLSFLIPTKPLNVYPTTRIDWQAKSSLAVRGVLNLWYRDLARNPQFPGLDFVNAGFKSNYYILSTAADWAPRSNLVSQFNLGVQSNWEEFNPGNDDAAYGNLGRRITYPTTANFGVGLTPLYPTNNVLPIPRNNPVINFLNTTTLLKGNHTFTFGGTLRHTYQWESTWQGAAGGPAFNLGIAAGDPAASMFNAIPPLRSADLPRAQTLYAFLTGRIASITGNHNVDDDTQRYGPNPVVRREAQTVGGIYAQDSWRLTPHLTMNYGLRWELSGAMQNTNDIYTSPPFDHILGPSAELFQPGSFSSVRDPQVDLRPRPYKSDLLNLAPNFGVSWNPDVENGVFGRLLGKQKSVIRGSVALNYYDEGLITFLTGAGSNVGLTQSLSLAPGMPGFAPGGLMLTSSIPPLAAFPTEFQFPISQSLVTFAQGFSTIDPDLETPSVLNWNIGLQRELWRNAAFEIRYVGNRGYNLWRNYDLNEVNVIENGFLNEFATQPPSGIW